MTLWQYFVLYGVLALVVGAVVYEYFFVEIEKYEGTTLLDLFRR